MPTPTQTAHQRLADLQRAVEQRDAAMRRRDEAVIAEAWDGTGITNAPPLAPAPARMEFARANLPPQAIASSDVKIEDFMTDEEKARRFQAGETPL